MMTMCACMGPQPGHALCPCKERLLLERRKVREQGLPTDEDFFVSSGRVPTLPGRFILRSARQKFPRR